MDKCSELSGKAGGRYLFSTRSIRLIVLCCEKSDMLSVVWNKCAKNVGPMKNHNCHVGTHISIITLAKFWLCQVKLHTWHKNKV